MLPINYPVDFDNGLYAHKTFVRVTGPFVAEVTHDGIWNRIHGHRKAIARLMVQAQRQGASMVNESEIPPYLDTLFFVGILTVTMITGEVRTYCLPEDFKASIVETGVELGLQLTFTVFSNN